MYLVNPKVGDKLVVSNTDMLLKTLPDDPDRTGMPETLFIS